MLQAGNFSCSDDGPELDGEAVLLLEVPLLLAKASGAFTRFWELALVCPQGSAEGSHLCP